MDSLFYSIRPNIVQSIRAFRAEDLEEEARQLGHHFLYANLAQAQTKPEVLETIAAQFMFPEHFGKNFDALFDSLTDPSHKMGSPLGFVVVLDQLPLQPKFDKDMRQQLLDVFQDVADYWADRQVAFRCFYSFQSPV